jgi:hypothetical protein
LKTRKFEVTEARSIEDAMDKAIEKAENYADSGPTLRINKVTFKGLEALVSYRDHNFVYTFEAEFEE